MTEFGNVFVVCSDLLQFSSYADQCESRVCVSSERYLPISSTFLIGIKCFEVLGDQVEWDNTIVFASEDRS